MPYAFIAEVEFADDDLDASRRMLNEGLIPVAKSLPGFRVVCGLEPVARASARSSSTPWTTPTRDRRR